MERYLEDWVQAMQNTRLAEVPNISMTWGERIHHGFQHAHDIVIKVWSYIVLGIGLGALIHGYIPESFMVSFMGSDAWWAVPAAVLLGIPLYTNAAGIIPVVQALLSKGAALGTVLAFMMSVIALSAPEMLILRKVLRPQLIITFVGIVATGILLVGYVFNWVL
ncbi:membrane protein, partial [Achromatium sp. WMS2]